MPLRVKPWDWVKVPGMMCRFVGVGVCGDEKVRLYGHVGVCVYLCVAECVQVMSWMVCMAVGVLACARGSGHVRAFGGIFVYRRENGAVVVVVVVVVVAVTWLLLCVLQEYCLATFSANHQTPTGILSVRAYICSDKNTFPHMCVNIFK